MSRSSIAWIGTILAAALVVVLAWQNRGLRADRDWFRPAVEAICGVVALLRADLPAAHAHLTAGTIEQLADDQRRMDEIWFLPNDPAASAYVNLAVAHMVGGDLVAAESDCAHARRRAVQLGFPKGPYSLGYALFVETWVRIEAGRLDAAAETVDDLIELAERHGFDQWRLVGATQQTTIAAFRLLAEGDPDPSESAVHLATLADLTDMLLKLGLAIYSTSFTAHLARLLIAAGRPAEARDRIDTALALAESTGMHLYDAELLRLRAQTAVDIGDRIGDIDAERRAHQAAMLAVAARLHAGEGFALRGEQARPAVTEVLSRLPAGGWPERQRAQALLQKSGNQPR